MNFIVIAFVNTHAAVVTEKLLKPHFKLEVIPTLRELSASCGISVKLLWEDRENVVNFLKDTDEPDSSMYTIYAIEHYGQENVSVTAL